MQWFKRLVKRLRGRNRRENSDGKNRFRRLIVEQYEDRRVLAAAVDDYFVIEANTPLTDNTWSNDSYNASWEIGYWNCTESTWVEGYWGDEEVWQDGYWEDPVWYEGYYDENDEWQEGYWSPTESVWHDGYWETVNVWHDGYWECTSEEFVATGTEYASNSIDSYPENGTLSDIDGGVFTYTPFANFSGTDSFTYTITDNQDSSTATVTINVNGPPVANDDDFTTDEDTPLIIDVLANDTDPNNDLLTAEIIGPMQGSIESNPDGTYTYTPPLNFYGTDTFGYWASDGLLSSELAMVTITVNESNVAPLAIDDYYGVSRADINERQTLEIDVADGLLANDVDEDGDTLSVTIVQNVGVGLLTLNSDGSFIYTHGINSSGFDSFTYRVTDGRLWSDATVYIMKGYFPGADTDYIVATDDEYSIASQADSFTVNVANGVLVNDTNPGGRYTVGVVEGPTHGTVVLGDNGDFIYDPEGSFVGLDSFTYNFRLDGTVISPVIPLVATVTIKVGVPTARDDYFTALNDTPLVVPADGLLTNDTDPDADNLIAQIVAQPAHGILTFSDGGTAQDFGGGFTYTPNVGFTGFDSFVYRAGDGNSFDEAVAHVTVGPLSFTIGLNAVGTVTGVPRPDTNGAVGINHIVELLNSSFSVYDKSTGALMKRMAPTDFWGEALVAGGGNSSIKSKGDARVIFDQSSGRWFASALTVGDFGLRRGFILAVSDTSDPTGQWKGFTLLGNVFGVDFPLLGVDAEGVYVQGWDEVTRQIIVYSVPKSDLLADQATVSRATLIERPLIGEFSWLARPVIDFFTAPDQRQLFISPELHLWQIFDPAAANASLSTGVRTIANEVQRLTFTGPTSPDAQFKLSIADLPTIPSKFIDGNKSILTELINYSPTPTLLASNIRQKLDQAFGSSVVGVSIVSENTFDISFHGNYAGVGFNLIDVPYNDNAGEILVDRVSPGAPPRYPLVPAKQPPPGSKPFWQVVNPASSAVYKADKVIWMAYSTGVDGRNAIRWVKIDTTVHNNYVVKTGLITDPQLDLVYPSIAANLVGDVVIGFTGTGAGTGQYPSAYAVVGQTDTNGETTFSGLTLLKRGATSFFPEASGSVGWGDYSATVADPGDPYDFWTFQEYVAESYKWGVEFTQIHVTPPGGRPVALDDPYYTPRNTILNIQSPNAGILSNDSDPELDPLFVRLVQHPTRGTLSLNGNGTFSYTPNPGFEGVDTFTYWALDHTSFGQITSDTSMSKTATVTINVGHLPESSDDGIYQVLEDIPLTVPANGVLSNDEDGDDDTLTAVIVSPPAHGSVVLNADGSFVYTPTENTNGPDSFTYRADDGFARGNLVTVSMGVLPVNDAPAGADKTVATSEDVAYTFSIADFGFTDPLDTPANALSAVKISSLATAGTIRLDGIAVTVGQMVSAGDIAAGKLVFVPVANANGSPYTSFTFQVKDDGGTANGGGDLDPTPNTVTINVTSVNDAPAGTDATVTTNEDTDHVFSSGDFGFSDANDVPADSLLNVILTVPPASLGTMRLGGAIQAPETEITVPAGSLNTLTFTPATDLNGAALATIPFKVQDDGGTANGGIDTDPTANTITINVASVNDPPVRIAGTVADLTVSDEAGATTLGLQELAYGPGGGSDEDGQIMNYKITTLPDPSMGTIVTASGQPVVLNQFVNLEFTLRHLKFKPAPNARGTVTFGWTTTDYPNGTANGGGESLVESLTITIIKPHPWHNTSLPYDVNADGLVTVEDANLITAYLNAHGAGAISANADAPDLVNTFYVDADKNNYVYAADALDVINYVNAFVGGSVYVDRNGNGRRDLTEVGIAGVTVHLDGNAGPEDDLTADSDMYGRFKFSQNAPNFELRLLPEDQPAGYSDGNDFTNIFFVTMFEEEGDPEDEDDDYFYFHVVFPGGDNGGLLVNFGLIEE